MALTLHVGHREVNLKLLDNLPSDRGAMQASRGGGWGERKTSMVLPSTGPDMLQNCLAGKALPLMQWCCGG